MLQKPVNFFVPTGAFGNALGGFIAKMMMGQV
jgi:threonine synthase